MVPERYYRFFHFDSWIYVAASDEGTSSREGHVKQRISLKHKIMPVFVAREDFVKGSGKAFDPKFVDIMLRIIDAESGDLMQEDRTSLHGNTNLSDLVFHFSVTIDSKSIIYESIVKHSKVTLAGCVLSSRTA